MLTSYLKGMVQVLLAYYEVCKIVKHNVFEVACVFLSSISIYE
jgi:hypothetical protein